MPNKKNMFCHSDHKGQCQELPQQKKHLKRIQDTHASTTILRQNILGNFLFYLLLDIKLCSKCASHKTFPSQLSGAGTSACDIFAVLS